MSGERLCHVHRTWYLLFLAGVTALGGPSATAQEWGWHRVEVTGPPARHSHAMAYDGARGVVVLFGGLNGGNDRKSVESGDTWEYRCPQESPKQEVVAEPGE